MRMTRDAYLRTAAFYLRTAHGAHARWERHGRARQVAVSGENRAWEASPSTPCARTRRLERQHREVWGQPQVHRPDGLVPGLGAKGMMPQDLDIAEIALQ